MDFRGKTILITGITGSIGTWFAKYFTAKGANVIGIARNRGRRHSLFDCEGMESRIVFCRGSVTDRVFLQQVSDKYKPELIFHFGGQAIVQRAEEDKGDTYAANVMGTLNVLEMMKNSDSIITGLFVTTAKCYEKDCPVQSVYHKSRECADILIETYYNVLLREQSKGIILFKLDNVIAGGDWGENRLIPECIRAYLSGCEVQLKNPDARLYWNDIYSFLAAVEWLFCRGEDLLEFRKYGIERNEYNHFSVSQIAKWVKAYAGSGKNADEDFQKVVSQYQMEKRSKDAFGFWQLGCYGQDTIKEAIRHAVDWYRR